MDVLLIDDDEAFVNLISKKLESYEEINIHPVKDPENVMETLKSIETDCILCEYELPGKNGLKLFRELRDDFDTPFILFTNYKDNDIIGEGFEAGIDEHIYKNANSPQCRIIVNRIKNVVKRHQGKKKLSDVGEGYSNIEADLIQDPNFLREIIDLIPAAIYAKNNKGELVLANEYFGKIFGLENLKDIIGVMPSEAPVKDREAELIRETDKKVLESGETVNISEEEVTDREGNRHIIETTKIPFKPEEKDKNYLTGVSIDITDRKERENSLESILDASREMAAAKKRKKIADIAVETMVSGLEMPITSIYLYDREENLFKPFSNSKRSREMFNTSPIDKKSSLAGEVFEEQETRFFEDLEGESPVYNPDTPLKSEVIAPLGQEGVIMSGSSEKKAFSQTDIYLVKLLASVTEASMNRAEREEVLRKREKELEKQNERLNQFASILSHDLRGPLNIAQGYLELARDTKEDEDLLEVQKAHNRIEKIIESMLTLAKHTQDIEKEELNMEELAKSSWKYASSEKEGMLEIEESFSVETDRNKIMDVLENLFSNALEHSEGETKVVVGPLERGFYVEDNGPGISEEERDKVTEFGYSIDEGTGLGLSIVEQISNFLGFDMEITESAEGGARFEFREKD